MVEEIKKWTPEELYDEADALTPQETRAAIAELERMDPQKLTPELIREKLKLTDIDIARLAQLRDQSSVLNEIFSGDWREQANGLEILSERLRKVDLPKMFGQVSFRDVLNVEDLETVLLKRFSELLSSK